MREWTRESGESPGQVRYDPTALRGGGGACLAVIAEGRYPSVKAGHCESIFWMNEKAGYWQLKAGP